MKNIFILLLYIGLCSFVTKDDAFKAEQLSYPRVRTAYQEKIAGITKLYGHEGIDLFKSQIFLRAFKQERILELWARSDNGKFKLIKTYDFCFASGEPGPKRKCGDRQVPEGFYFINDFNPASKYFLSLGINYPNASDKILGNKFNVGGDIYIHGDCKSIGCIAITDELIKEVYIMAMEAKANGQNKIPVHIFPAKMDEPKWKNLKDQYCNSSDDLESFWMNIKQGYDYFEKNKTLPTVSVLKNGKYHFE